MSGETIKEFLVGLGFEVDEAGLKKFESGVKTATIAVAAIGAASVAAAGAVVAFVAGVADKLDSVGDAADRIGVTTEELMRLQYAAQLSGSSAEAATASMANLGRIAGEAVQGVGRGAKVFEDLGLSAKDASGKIKPTTQLLGEVGEKIKDLSRQEQVAVLGKLGIDPSMIGTITGGMQELASEFDALYSAAEVDLNQAAEASGLFNDALDRLKMTFDAVKTAVAVKFMPQITKGIDLVRKFLVQNLPKIINAITPVINIILRIAEAFLQLAGRIASGAMTVIGWFMKLNDATGGWAAYILAAAAAWKYLNLAFLKTPLGMLIALAAAVALLIDDFLTFKEGGESLIDWGSGFGVVMQVVTSILTGLLAGILAVKAVVLAKAAAIAIAQAATTAYGSAVAAFNTIMTVMRSVIAGAKIVMAAFNAVMLANPIGLVIAAVAGLIAIGYLLISNWDTVKEWFVGLWTWFAEAFPQIAAFITAPFNAAAAAVMAVFETVKSWFVGLWDWFAGTFPTVAGFITGAFDKAAASVLGIFEGVKSWFSGFIDWIKAGFAKISEWGSAIKGFFGGGGAENAKQTTGGGGAPALAPSPQAAAAITGGQQNVNQQTQIVVQGGGNPEATARAVAGQQNRVNADMARNMKGAAR